LLDLAATSHYVDIRNQPMLHETMLRARPDMVFHLAAQPLVRRSYQNPLETWATNVMGTAHVLDACRQLPDLKAVVVVTTDKCYENKEWVWGYREIDPLGGHDPYSASKAGSELVAASFRRSFLQRPGQPSARHRPRRQRDRRRRLVRGPADPGRGAICGRRETRRNTVAERHATLATRAGVPLRLSPARAAIAQGATGPALKPGTLARIARAIGRSRRFSAC
jgi:hypothetical protein